MSREEFYRRIQMIRLFSKWESWEAKCYYEKHWYEEGYDDYQAWMWDNYEKVVKGRWPLSEKCGALAREGLCWSNRKASEIKLGTRSKHPEDCHFLFCHSLFCDCYSGYDTTFIQLPNYEEIVAEADTIILEGALLSRGLLAYDQLVFQAMKDDDYIMDYYQPYFFSFVMEMTPEDYEKLQKRYWEIKKVQDDKNYMYFRCNLNNISENAEFVYSGYVVEGAGSIEERIANIELIIEESSIFNKQVDQYLCLEKTDQKIVDYLKKGLDKSKFMEYLQNVWNGLRVTQLEAYTIGDGNCICVEGGDRCFFYDVGYNYRHTPKLPGKGKTSRYQETMQRIREKKPEFVILSHWHMDHIAGSVVLKKGCFDVKWFAPDCRGAGANAKRLARYLALKKKLILISRDGSGDFLDQIDIPGTANGNNALATYYFYLGGKADCDKSASNCEGIAVYMVDREKEKTVLMMGDVNYESFNKARKAQTNVPLIEDMEIDYIIAPHHGSKRTNYDLLGNKKQGIKAVVCCVNDASRNRPNDEHRGRLRDRFMRDCFDPDVLTTEQANKNKTGDDYGIIISIS